VTIPFSALQALESFYEKFDPDFIDIRTKAREVLQREDDLNEIVQVDFAHHFFIYLHKIP
jgi:V-type H+-transporting ATPase subunit A